MPYNGSGTFVRLNNWTNDANSNLPISATKFDNEDTDFASGLSLCLTRDGQGAPTTALTWTQPLTLNRTTDGSIFTVGRTGGSNNPSLQASVTDGTGITLNLTTAQQLALAIQGTNAISIASTRAVTIGAPSSGIAVTLNGSGASPTLQVNGGTISRTSEFDSTSVNGSFIGLSNSGTEYAGIGSAKALITGGSLNDIVLAASAGFGNAIIATNAAARISVNQTGNVTINAPSSGVALTVSAVSGAFALQATGSGTASAGVFNGGGNANGNIESSDAGRVNLWTFGRDNASTGNFVIALNGTQDFAITTAGAIQGRGPVAAALVDMTPDKGSFTATLNGNVATNPTATVNWVRMGNIVMMDCPAGLLATSNGTASPFISGVPASLVSLRNSVYPCTLVEDNSVFQLGGGVICNVSGQITFVKGPSGGPFTNVGSKGINAGASWCYPLA